MKIILSVEPVKYPLTGIGRYTFELARRIGQLDDVEALQFYANGALRPDIPSPEEIASSSIAHVSLLNRIKRQLARNKMIVDLYRLYRNQSSNTALNGLEDHVYHGPNFYLPDFDGPSVVTIHDLSVFTMPHFHPKERVVVLGKEVRNALAKASMIVTDSDYIRSEVISYFGLEQNRVGVAKLACGEEFHPREESAVKPVLDQYGIGYNGYALYTGTIEPRKNLANLLDAYSRLPSDLKRRYPLVLAGYKGWNNEAIMTRIEAGQRQGWVKYLGFVPQEHLPPLYAGARLFTFPSVYEGFGLPVLEAMASGTPVMTSPVASLPEVGGEAALYAGPQDIEAMTNALQKGLDDAPWREGAKEAGIQQAQRFNWQACAADTAQIYRQAQIHHQTRQVHG